MAISYLFTRFAKAIGLFFPLAFALLALPLMDSGQNRLSVSICDASTTPDGDAILTICTYEHGMVVMPQPQLFLEVFKDGRAVTETSPAYREGAGNANNVPVKKEIRLSTKELQEMMRLGQTADFQQAKASYPIVHGWDDSSLETTVIFNGQNRSKKITLGNYMPREDDNKKHYPPSLVDLMEMADDLHDRLLGIVRQVPSVSFCELIKNRDRYLGRTVVIDANFEYPPTGEFLDDLECTPAATGVVQTPERIAVRYAGTDEEIGLLKKRASAIREKRFGGRARVRLTGILRSDRAQASDSYRFEIGKFMSIEPIVLPYQGSLEPGRMYSDTYDYLKPNEVFLSSPLKMPFHHAGRLEWTNADDFPQLRRHGRKHIIFRVVSLDITKIGSNRWNSIYSCEILELKHDR
jgi:hypothetical protein